MTYARTTVLYYSGTGNSRRVATWVADAAEDAGSDTQLSPLDALPPDEGIGGETGWGPGSLLVLALPTHGFTAPWAVLRFTLRLPRLHGTHAAVVATRGGLKIGPIFTPGFEGTAALLPALILSAKGYHVRGAVAVDMPSNWTALHPSLPPGAVEAIIERARHKMGVKIDHLLAGRRWSAPRLVWLLGLLLLPVSILYLLGGRFFLAKLFFASERCTGCGLCANHCPHHAIKMVDQGTGQRPFWTLRCESCMRCMAYCPERAVEASHALALGTYLVASSLPWVAALTWLTAQAPALSFLTRTLPWIAAAAAPVILLIAVYPLFHRLLRLGPIVWLFSRATLTRVYRRYHEPHTTLADLARRQP